MSSNLAAALRVASSFRDKPIKLRKPPRPKWPHKQRSDYYRDLLGVLARMRAVVQRDLVPQLGLFVAQVNITRPEDAPIRHDAPGDAIQDVLATVSVTIDADIDDAEIEMLAQRNVVKTSVWHANELQKQVQHVAAINVYDDTTGLLPHLETAVAENVRLIKGLKSKTLDEIKGVVLRGARTGIHQSVIAEQIEQQFGMSKRRAALIATDQVGKLNSELNSIRQQRLGVRRYRWSSSQDERVRKRHRQLNGTIQEWAKPPVTDERTGERAHPGQPIRCRCQPIPIIDDVLADAGLIDPSEVETTQPQKGRTRKPLGPVDVPPMPPANVPPSAGDKPRKRKRQPPPPGNTNAPPLNAFPAPANTQTPSGGGGAGGGGGGAGGGPPGAGGPPDGPKRQQILTDWRRGMNALPTQGGQATLVRAATRALVTGYGLALTPNQSALGQLVVRATGFAGFRGHDGHIGLDPSVAAAVKSALAKVKRNATLTWAEADALSTLVHEELHCMGAVRDPLAYVDAGKMVEEVATETLARGMTRDVLGAHAGRVQASHALALPLTRVNPARAYDQAIFDVMGELQTIVGVDAAKSQELLRAAALEYKRSVVRLDTPEAFAARFAECVPGLSANQRLRFEVSLVHLGQASTPQGKR